MLYLQDPTQEDLDKYYDLMIVKIINALKETKLNASLEKYLTGHEYKHLREILTSKPTRLLEIHNEVSTLIENENMSSIFNYTTWISNSKETSYYLAAKVNSNTCTYCNRIYTLTVIPKGKSHKNGIIRPQFDHWFSKSKYPVLALSYYNLIPCCPICNSSIKGIKDFELGKYIHPYIKETDNREKFTFTFDVRSATENNIRINVTDKDSKTYRTLEELKIEEIYNAHSNLELRDLLDLKYKYSENYLNDLFSNTFKKLKVSKSEAYRMVFGVESNEADFHKRPFSKFKKDILEELGIILD